MFLYTASPYRQPAEIQLSPTSEKRSCAAPSGPPLEPRCDPGTTGLPSGQPVPVIILGVNYGLGFQKGFDTLKCATARRHVQRCGPDNRESTAYRSRYHCYDIGTGGDQRWYPFPILLTSARCASSARTISVWRFSDALCSAVSLQTCALEPTQAPLLRVSGNENRPRSARSLPELVLAMHVDAQLQEHFYVVELTIRGRSAK